MLSAFLRVMAMIETVVTVKLPVDETLRIKKNRLTPNEIQGNEKRLAVVTGLHGDEVGGQYVCYELIRRIKQDYDSLRGIVDVYPALNPLGLDTAKRESPFTDIDINTCFPGNDNGSIDEYVAAQILEDIKGAEVCIDVHSSSIFLKEQPQVRINDDNVEEMLPFARSMNADLVWIHPSSTVKEGSLAYALNEIGVKTMVIEAGVALQIYYEYCDQLIEGIFALMKKMGIWVGEIRQPKEPVIVDDSNIAFMNCETSGTFIAQAEHGTFVKKGDVIGRVVKVITGAVEEVLTAPCDGVVFSLRAYPVVEEGSLIARIVKSDFQSETAFATIPEPTKGGADL